MMFGILNAMGWSLFLFAAMGAAEGDSIDKYEQSLCSTNLESRVQALCQLKQMGALAGPALPFIEPLFKDESIKIQMAAIAVAGEIGPAAKEAVPQLVAFLKSDDVRLLRSVLTALGQIGSEASVAMPEFVRLLRHQDEAIRTVAAWTIGRMGSKDARAARLLAAMLSDGSFTVAKSSANALGRLGDDSPQVISALCERLQSSANDLVLSSLMSLVKLHADPKVAGPALKKAIVVWNNEKGIPGWRRDFHRQLADRAMDALNGKISWVPDRAGDCLGKRMRFKCRVASGKGRWLQVFDEDLIAIASAFPCGVDMASFSPKEWIQVDGMLNEKWISDPCTRSQVAFQVVRSITVFSASRILVDEKVVAEKINIPFDGMRGEKEGCILNELRGRITREPR
ncbi:MAG: HEAT repeat domain-containing protein [Verrucomicrobiae bacterium]|nr:HEAT repeat domain-containing protein [Verrucomicrobiae bacterium]